MYLTWLIIFYFSKQVATNGTASPKSNGVATNGVHGGDHDHHHPEINSNIGDKKSSEDIVRIIGQHLLTMGLS